MEEKKVTKISLSTFFLVLAIIAICIMGYFIFKLNDDKTKATEQVNNLNNQIKSLENSVNSLQNTIETNKNKEPQTIPNTSQIQKNEVSQSNVVNTLDITEIKEMVKNASERERLQITSARKDNDKFIIKANFYTPIVFSEEEYLKMVQSKKIVLNNVEYVYSDEDKNRDLFGNGYVYIEGENIEGGYWIEKYNGGYIFVNEIGGCWSIIEKVKATYEINIDKNIEVDDFLSGGQSQYTLEEYLKNHDITKGKYVFYLSDNVLKISADLR